MNIMGSGGSAAASPKSSYDSLALIGSISAKLDDLQQKLAPILQPIQEEKALIPEGSELLVKLGQIYLKLDSILQRVHL